MGGWVDLVEKSIGDYLQQKKYSQSALKSLSYFVNIFHFLYKNEIETVHILTTQSQNKRKVKNVLPFYIM